MLEEKIRTKRQVQINNQPLRIHVADTNQLSPGTEVSNPPAMTIQPESKNQVYTPRTRHLLGIINTRSVKQIKTLKGVGSKRAETIINALGRLDDECLTSSVSPDRKNRERGKITLKNLEELSRLKGVGTKTVEVMRSGLVGV